VTAPLEATAKASAEATAAAIAFQAAIARLGIMAIAEALRLWRRVPANKAAELADDWLEDSVRLVMTRRARSRELAVAYYRLARALRTGTTIPDPYDPIPRVVTLGELRREFALLTESVSQSPESPAEAVSDPSPTSDTRDGQEPSEGDDTAIPIEEIDGITEDGDEVAQRLEVEAEEEARIVLTALGPISLNRRVSEIDTTRPADEVDALRDEAHAKAGARQAAAADRIVKNAARSNVHSLGKRDKRVIGYVRVSQSGTPCGFCAMLISRGVIFYSSAESGGFATSDANKRAEGELYHDNCNCVAEPVYSMSHYENDPLFALNRDYSNLWPVVTKGLSGKEALTAWRRYFRRMQANGDADTGTALAA
jgi:hypothetical protein